MGADKELPTPRIWTVSYMALNYFSSVGIVWMNKAASNMGFTWTTSLTCLHFLFTYLGLELCATAGMFERKALPAMEVIRVSLAFCGFVVFNNLSLQYNAVGLYQLLKVLTTPVIAVLQYFLYGTTIPMMELVSLVPIIMGVCLATVSHLEVNSLGLMWGCFGILSTSMYQIWVKEEQKRLGCNAQQLLYFQAPISTVMLLFVAAYVDDAIVGGPFDFEWTNKATVAVFGSAAMAFLVNLSIFLVIGKTDPIAYNVLGYAKLCLILCSGPVLFNEPVTPKVACGTFLALVGIFWYTWLRLPARPAKKEAQ
mmetsp:Transcript_3092/g.7450  ORF Transcript_3092/g.7450 Transcript_3092/m.7450 type:complete len:310 (-) Transcript_3092:43-972(-)